MAKNPGMLVELPDGRRGRTKNSDPKITTTVVKVPVYLDDGKKVLVEEKNLKLRGFID